MMMTNVLPLLFAHAPFPADDADAVHDAFVRARRGDDEGVAALCQLMRPKLYRTALSVLKDPAAADDIAHDAILRALKKRALFLGRGSVSGWMCRIAQNLAKNARRDQQRRGELLDVHGTAAVSLHAASAPPRPDERVLQSERAGRIESALDNLPARQRDVARLRLVAELSYDEIAAVLNISAANARVALAAARKSLQSTLADEVAS